LFSFSQSVFAIYGRIAALLLVIWLTAALGTRVPVPISTRTYSLPVLDSGQAARLADRLERLPGVREVRVAAAERQAYLAVDSARFDDENVHKLLAPEIARDALQAVGSRR
jgi:hypothetical protein